jgi:hypothetical protein
LALTGRHEAAAAMVAADIITDEQIAQQAGVTRKTLWNWRQLPEFAERVEAIRAAIRANARITGIALVENRVAALNERWELMKQLRRARRPGRDHAPDVPGGQTGLLVRSYKVVGSGEPRTEKVGPRRVPVRRRRSSRSCARTRCRPPGAGPVAGEDRGHPARRRDDQDHHRRAAGAPGPEQR